MDMAVRGDLPEDIFVTLRFNQEEIELIVDMYRLP
jgi:hypothetical protein